MHNADSESTWERQTAIRTVEGTTPKESQWTKINTPEVRKEVWNFRDLVMIPESLEPGRYVLSFRWDSQNTPQVWNSCANVEIV